MDSPPPSQFLHPVLMFAAQSAVSAVALSALQPSRTSFLSLVTMPVQLGCVGTIISRARYYVRPAYAAWLASFSITTCLRCLGQCFIRRNNTSAQKVSKQDRADHTKQPSEEQNRQNDATNRVSKRCPRLFQGLWTSFVFLMDFRHLNSSNEAKNTPLFSSRYPAYTPSRRAFLVTQALKAICCYLFIDLLTGSPLPANATVDLAPDRMHFFSRPGSVATDEIIQRYVMAVSVLAIGAAMLEVLHPLAASVAVGSGMSEPRDWRPQFGSLASAFTMRRFWGEVWHQDLRITFTTLSDWIADAVLGSSADTQFKRLLRRYTKLVLVFGISGVLHWLDEVAAGMSGSRAKSYVFFLYQALGIMIEDAVEGVFAPSEASNEQRKPGWMARLGGYAWTLSFFALSVPWWVYPATHHAAVLGAAPESLVSFILLKWRWT